MYAYCHYKPRTPEIQQTWKHYTEAVSEVQDRHPTMVSLPCSSNLIPGFAKYKPVARYIKKIKALCCSWQNVRLTALDVLSGICNIVICLYDRKVITCYFNIKKKLSISLNVLISSSLFSTNVNLYCLYSEKYLILIRHAAFHLQTMSLFLTLNVQVVTSLMILLLSEIVSQLSIKYDRNSSLLIIFKVCF